MANLNLFYLNALATARTLQAWLRYLWHRHNYTKSRQWLDIGAAKSPEQVYAELQAFVKDVVGLSPRPYGHGAFGLVLGAMWGPEEQPTTDRWQVTFTYQNRQDIYQQLTERLAGWSEPPLAVMVVIMPYGAVMARRPGRA